MGCALLVCPFPEIFGQDALSSDEQQTSEHQAPVQSPPAAARSGILVMHSLEVVVGTIVQQGNIYRVTNAEGEIVIPAANVLFECGSREEAYLLLKPRVAPNSPGDHASMAKWCVKNELLEEARDEMQAAVRLNPNNEENRSLLRYVEELLNPFRTPEDVAGTRRDRFNLAEGFLKQAEPLGGLTRSQAREFTSRVQPILLNSCATARCHRDGNNQNLSFRLKPLNRYQSLQTAHFNLDQILEQVNRDHPEKSPVLQAHRAEDSQIESPFDKPRGDYLEQTILNWIISLETPEAEIPIPSEVGSSNNANIISAITRDKNRRERRQQESARRKTETMKSSLSQSSSENYLSELLPEKDVATIGDD